MTSLTAEQLLNCLSQFLNSDGGLKSENECVRFNNCMKQLGKSMQNICLYLNVINATGEEEVLSKLLTCGAWATLYEWLNEYKELDESPVLVLLLETFQRLPVTMDMLKSNSSAKVIKSLRKHTDDEVKQRATHTVDKWMQLIKTKTGGASPAHPYSRNGEHKEKKKKRHKSTEKSQDKPNTSPSHNNDNTDRDVPSPPPPSIFKEISKSDSDRMERTTAKQHNVKERSAGVEAGVIKPKPRGSKPPKSASSSTPSAYTSSKASLTSSISSNGSSHKRMSIDLPGMSELGSDLKKPKIDPDKEEDFGKAKLIAPLPKPAHIIQDSDGFMAALLQPRTQVVKKRRSANKTPTSPTEKSSPPLTPVSPISAPPSFYKDTLEGPSGVSPPHPSSADAVERMSPVGSTVSSHSNSEDSKAEPMDTSVTKPAKKRVCWKAEKDLRQYHYFELLEDERVNVNRLRDQGGFDEMKKREMISDRAALKSIHMEGEKLLPKHSNAPPAVTEHFKWKRPELMDLPPSKFQPGHLSKEIEIQDSREITVLAAIYFSKAAIPTTASEPDNIEDTEPSSSESTLTVPLEVADMPSVESYQISYDQQLDLAPTHMDTSTRGSDTVATVADLVPGVTANDMDLIQKLANGEAGQEILEALANTSPDYISQIMQTEGMAPLENDGYRGEQMNMEGPHLDCIQPLMNQRYPLQQQNVGYGMGPPRGGFNGRGGGPRPPFHRGGFRGGWHNRGRGGPRGRGRGGGGNRECHYFHKMGKCDFGSNCSFLHTVR